MFNAMTRAEIWLQDTLDKPLGIEDLANHLGYSASQVRRQFRLSFHISPNAYREKRRIERAAVLLSLTPLNIAQIATRCGYQNHSSFSRAFQRHYQLTPRNFRLTLRSILNKQASAHDFATSIEKANDHQMILMRLYKAPDDIAGLGNSNYHNKHLACLQTRLRLSTTVVAMPDLLTNKINAINSDISHLTRTDIGLYLGHRENAQNIAFPVPYRRVDTPTHYYAKTSFQNLEYLPKALNDALSHLLRRRDYHISGHSPYILWQTDHLELRIPLME